MKSFRESFEKRRDDCLSKCAEWDKKQRNPLDDLQYKIKDPIRAYHNYIARMEVWELLEKIKTKIVYALIGDALWKDPKYEFLYQWLNGYYGSAGWHDLPLEYCAISPRCLQEVGFKETDELWYWSTPPETWKYMFGRAGYCVVRNGMIIWSMITEEN